MDLQFFSTIIFSDNLEASVKFYNEVLGFEIAEDYGRGVTFKNGISLWRPQSNDKIMKKTHNLKNKEDHSLEIYLFTDDIDSVYNELKGKNVDFIHGVEDEVWGQRVLRFYDPDKHIIAVGEYPEKFIKKMIAQGSSIGQVSRQTSIPIKLLMKIINEE